MSGWLRLTPVARNRYVRQSTWSLAAIVLPAGAGLLAIPVLMRGLGPARFGLLALAWVVLEYLAVFDLGLSKSTTRYVAQRLHTGAPEIGHTVGASLVAQSLLGIVAGLVLAAATPFLMERVLEVPHDIVGDARGAFMVLAATMPFVLLGLALRALLEGAQRFDLSAAVRAPASTATFLLPALASALGATLTQVMVILLGVRIAAAGATALIAWRAIPGLRLGWPRGIGDLRALAGYGGWIGVTNVLSPFFLYFDRLALGAIVGVTAVGIYSAPSELALRLLLVPAAVVGPVFTAAAALHAAGHRAEFERLYVGSTRALAALLLPVVLLGVAFARPIIELWLGARYVDPGATVLRVLLSGVLLTSVAHVPVAFLQAAGGARLTGRLHGVMAAVHVVIASLLVARYGILGAAIAWTTRVTVDACLVFALASSALRLPLPFWRVTRSEPAVP